MLWFTLVAFSQDSVLFAESIQHGQAGYNQIALGLSTDIIYLFILHEYFQTGGFVRYNL